MANEMNFEEKIDAMRTTLELAIHDIEAMGSKIEALRLASSSQYDSIKGLMTISAQLVETAQAHERRISGLEGRA
jgi:hypothetical protein